MTSQKRDPHRDSDKRWPFLLEVARTLYGNAQFEISSARRFSAFNSVPVSTFDERPRKCNVEQIKTLLKSKRLRQSGKWENFKTPCLDTLFAAQPVNVFKEFSSIL